MCVSLLPQTKTCRKAYIKGSFREDLYHRFNEFSIYMPPLRECGSDIMLLADHFLRTANQELGRNVTSFSPEVIECFMNYRWQGNIRELKNVVRRATLITEGNVIQMKALPLEISNYRSTPVYEPVAVNHAATSEPAGLVKEVQARFEECGAGSGIRHHPESIKRSEFQ